MVLNIAHRGARSVAPENTLLAAEKAYEIGADMWETDISVTSDGQLILLHDDSLERTTNVRELFPDRDSWDCPTFTLGEIQTLDAGSYYIQNDPFGEIAKGTLSEEERNRFRGLSIPTLEEALLFTLKRDWPVNLEVKTLPTSARSVPVMDRVIDLLERMAVPPELFVLSSFNHEWLRYTRDRRPDYRVQALIGYPLTQPLNWKTLEFDTYNVNAERITEEEMAEKSTRGISINVYTLNSQKEMRRAIKMGVTGIFTDYPQRMRELGYGREGALTPGEPTH